MPTIWKVVERPTHDYNQVKRLTMGPVISSPPKLIRTELFDEILGGVRVSGHYGADS